MYVELTGLERAGFSGKNTAYLKEDGEPVSNFTAFNPDTF